MRRRWPLVALAIVALAGTASIPGRGSGASAVQGLAAYEFDRLAPDGQTVSSWLESSDLTARDVHTLTAAPAAGSVRCDWGARISPDGQRVAFLRSTRAHCGGTSTLARAADSVWIVNSNGSGLRRLIGPTHAKGVEHLVWSPDSRRLAFDRITTCEGTQTLVNVGLYTVDVDTTAVQRLPAVRKSELNSVLVRPEGWSTDSASVLFGIIRMRPHDCRYQAIRGATLATARVGSSRRRDIVRVSELGSAAWSPDGTATAFASGDGNSCQVYVHDLTGQRPRPVEETIPWINHGCAWATPDSPSLLWLDGSDDLLIARGPDVVEVNTLTGARRIVTRRTDADRCTDSRSPCANQILAAAPDGSTFILGEGSWSVSALSIVRTSDGKRSPLPLLESRDPKTAIYLADLYLAW